MDINDILMLSNGASVCKCSIERDPTELIVILKGIQLNLMLYWMEFQWAQCYIERNHTEFIDIKLNISECNVLSGFPLNSNLLNGTLVNQVLYWLDTHWIWWHSMKFREKRWMKKVIWSKKLAGSSVFIIVF